MRVPVGGFEEGTEERGFSENWVEGEAEEETVEGGCPAGGKVSSKSVASDVFYRPSEEQRVRVLPIRCFPGRGGIAKAG